MTASCEAVVTSGQHHNQQLQRETKDPNALLAFAEETLAEFMSKATGTVVHWVAVVGMKPGSASTGIISISHNCSGIAARACGFVSLEPKKVAELLKDGLSWYRDCRSLGVLHLIHTENGGTIEIVYMQVCLITLCLNTGLLDS